MALCLSREGIQGEGRHNGPVVQVGEFIKVRGHSGGPGGSVD